jgi:hypothetical protein
MHSPFLTVNIRNWEMGDSICGYLSGNPVSARSSAIRSSLSRIFEPQVGRYKWLSLSKVFQTLSKALNNISSKCTGQFQHCQLSRPASKELSAAYNDRKWSIFHHSLEKLISPTFLGLWKHFSWLVLDFPRYAQGKGLCSVEVETCQSCNYNHTVGTGQGKSNNVRLT